MAASRIRSVLAWHVHGSWMESFVSGHHRYLLPLSPDRGPDGRGRCGRDWPRTEEVPFDRLRDADVDVVVLQRPEELEMAHRWLDRRPGVDVPAVYVEHNAPRPAAATSVHPLADQSDIPIIHVTAFNRLMWDNGCAPTTIIEHGIADPGPRYTGEIPAAATMINEPVRRSRVVGTDLLGELGATIPIDVWGIGTNELNDAPHRRNRVTGLGDMPTARLWSEVAHRRVYLHTARWTSLGLSLVEAMFLGMPIVAVASTMAPLVVPEEAGVVSADVAVLGRALNEYLVEETAAEIAGKAARSFALAHFGLGRFLSQWDDVIESLCA
ncbi:glycosyltransferase [Mycobacterium crocinum]|uniref:Glycosyltransferase n=2 Tax=Mycolicibacterium crocinum TaxID=388459 RepID=A0ABY3TP46_9MYCO|nr:glycosyltransferase [Mycolicibacterium crocinum]MCV7215608.1 glycosyltransferase [Mycolicibacterium crocinum]ULN43033.2 glycosyltransferase [Mycolicibacterium crocinum]